MTTHPYITTYDDLIDQSRANGDQLVTTYHVGLDWRSFRRRLNSAIRGRLSWPSVMPWRAETIGPNPRCGAGWTRVHAWRRLARKLEAAGQLDPRTRARSR